MAGRALLLTALALPPAAGGQVLDGRVLEDGTDRPLASAFIMVHDANGAALAGTLADADGRFSLTLDRAGTIVVQAQLIGYETAEGRIDVPAGESVNVEFVLTATALPVDTLRVEARSRTQATFLQSVGFDERRENGVGVFIDRVEIEERSPRKITDLLRGKRGMRVIRQGRSNPDYDLRMRGSAGISLAGMSDCWPRIMLDGALVREGARGGQPLTTIDEIITPNLIAAIEVFRGPAETPTEFSGAGCGVVMLWTRRQ